MTDFNFDKKVNRFGTNSEKWDIRNAEETWDLRKSELPMWVADMDFEAAPCIKEAIRKRLKEGVFGYSYVPAEWYDAYISWWERRHGFGMKKDELIFCTGVVPAISSVIRKLTTPAEKVLVMTPVYNIFFHSIVNNGRVPLECPLIIGTSGKYEIDWERFTEYCEDPQTTMFLLCNPQNPIGILWDKETLTRIGAICAANGVLVLSDEIHCDIAKPGLSYTPFASINETNARNCIMCIAPSKAFNIAGLNSAAVWVGNPKLYNKVKRGLNTDEVAEPGVFAVQAAVAAFSEGEAWLNAMNSYIAANKAYVKNFIEKNLPVLKDYSQDATYLSWIDARALQIPKLQTVLRKEAGLWFSDGAVYGKGNDGFLRINVACPFQYVEEAMRRLETFVHTHALTEQG